MVYMMIYRYDGRLYQSTSFLSIDQAKEWAKNIHEAAFDAPYERDRQWRLFELTDLYNIGLYTLGQETSEPQRIGKLVEVFQTRKHSTISVVSVVDKSSEPV